MTIAHIGDSRAYTIGSDGRTNVLTTDHSLVKRLEDLGQITSDEAAVHPQRNVLYRALGQAETIDTELIAAPLPKSGYLLLCSDGLWGVVSENEMVNIVLSAVSPQDACQSLLAAANTAGGPDNISVIIIEFPG
jgi:serine/threonine protein phosphatase PrpC